MERIEGEQREFSLRELLKQLEDIWSIVDRSKANVAFFDQNVGVLEGGMAARQALDIIEKVLSGKKDPVTIKEEGIIEEPAKVLSSVWERLDEEIRESQDYEEVEYWMEIARDPSSVPGDRVAYLRFKGLTFTSKIGEETLLSWGVVSGPYSLTHEINIESLIIWSSIPEGERDFISLSRKAVKNKDGIFAKWPFLQYGGVLENAPWDEEEVVERLIKFVLEEIGEGVSSLSSGAEKYLPIRSKPE